MTGYISRYSSKVAAVIAVIGCLVSSAGATVWPVSGDFNLAVETVDVKLNADSPTVTGRLSYWELTELTVKSSVTLKLENCDRLVEICSYRLDTDTKPYDCCIAENTKSGRVCVISIAQDASQYLVLEKKSLADRRAMIAIRMREGLELPETLTIRVEVVDVTLASVLAEIDRDHCAMSDLSQDTWPHHGISVPGSVSLSQPGVAESDIDSAALAEGKSDCDSPASVAGENRFDWWIGQGERLAEYAEADSTGWLFYVDQDRLFRPLLADQREAQTRIGLGKAISYDRSYENTFDISVGGDLVLARRKFSRDKMFSASVRGLIASRFETGGFEPDDGQFPLLCSDYFGGLALAYADGPSTWEIFFHHESSHLGDETLLTNAYQWDNYSREATRILYSRDIGDLRLYGGGSYTFNSDNRKLDNMFAAIVGGEYRFDVMDQPCYAAFHCRAWEYNGWRPDYTGQVGWFWGRPKDNPLDTRIFLEFFEGHSNMGQYWDAMESTIILGAAMSF